MDLKGAVRYFQDMAMLVRFPKTPGSSAVGLSGQVVMGGGRFMGVSMMIAKFIAALFVLAFPGFCSDGFAQDDPQTMLALINAKRALHCVPSLVWSAEIAASAQQQADACKVGVYTKTSRPMGRLCTTDGGSQDPHHKLPSIGGMGK